MTASKSTLLLEHHLKQLKLPTIHRDYQAIGSACGKGFVVKLYEGLFLKNV